MEKKETIITVICCICHKFIETKDGEGVSGISHGWCKECAEIKMQEIEYLREDIK